jgi:hypothetical protein
MRFHFESGNWETTTNRLSLESLIRSRYGSSADWDIHFLAGSGRAFPLDAASQSETISAVGQALLSDDRSNFDILAQTLPESLGDLLGDSIEELGLQEHNRSKRESLTTLGELFRHPSPDGRVQLNPDVYHRARAVLFSLPRQDPLREALGAYDLFSFDAGFKFPAFAVATKPAFNIGTWDNQALAIDQQSGRCRAEISRIGNSDLKIVANTSAMPRALEISLERPWLNHSLLDKQVKNPNLAEKFFGAKGPLRVIPERFWVAMPDKIVMEFETPDEANLAQTWASAGDCCKVVCPDDSITLKPGSVRVKNKLAMQGIVDGSSPLLFAIVSNRRIAR